MSKPNPLPLLEFSEEGILSTLSEHNLIGSGGSGKVYLVQSDSFGHSVAVKKICRNGKRDLGQFLAEAQILSNIEHKNIVKLLYCIAGHNLRLLVYEYVENYSLEKWLFGRRRLQSGSEAFHVLDWPRRYKIATQVAQGLCHMHHDCNPPIIHRDIKSSNILLDFEFNAKIADFGLAKMIFKQGDLCSMSNIAGSFGYIAPEYHYTTKLSEKVDVYSFGVVLFELTTGKEPTCGDQSLGLAEWSWKHYEKKSPIEDALDDDIKQPCYIGEMTSVFNLGIRCTSDQPNSRPSMQEILEVLRHGSMSEDDTRMMKVATNEREVAPLLVSSNNKPGTRQVIQDAVERV